MTCSIWLITQLPFSMDSYAPTANVSIVYHESSLWRLLYANTSSIRSLSALWSSSTSRRHRLQAAQLSASRLPQDHLAPHKRSTIRTKLAPRSKRRWNKIIWTITRCWSGVACQLQLTLDAPRLTSGASCVMLHAGRLMPSVERSRPHKSSNHPVFLLLCSFYSQVQAQPRHASDVVSRLVKYLLP